MPVSPLETDVGARGSGVNGRRDFADVNIPGD